jgi:hypothetical protein
MNTHNFIQPDDLSITTMIDLSLDDGDDRASQSINALKSGVVYSH